MAEPAVALQPQPPEAELLTEAHMDDIDVTPFDPLFAQQWSSVPIQCTLAPEDAKDPTKTHTCRFIVPRQSYFFLHLDTITQTLAPQASEAGNVWFTWSPGGAAAERFVPLHMPISATMDYLYSCDPTVKHLVPLELLVHFRRPTAPEKDDAGSAGSAEKQAIYDAFNSTLCIRDREAAYASYEQLLKQGIVVRFGRVLNKADFSRTFKALFESVCNNNALDFWSLRYKLLSIGERMGDGLSSSKFAGIVVHCGGRSRVIRVKPSGEMLGVFLKEHIPLPLFRNLTRNQCHSTKELAPVVIQGLRPVYGSPLDSLVDMFSSTDFCLHIVVLPECTAAT